MKTLTQRITLKSNNHYGTRLPPEATGRALMKIAHAVQSAISMALRGRSRARGPAPAWLSAAADIRFVGHEGEGDSVLCFEAPRLGAAASEVYDQGLLWDIRPDKDDTGLDLLADVIDDVAGGKEDSARFDHSLLRSIAGFKSVLNGEFQEIVFHTRRYEAPRYLSLNPNTISSAERLFSATPVPQRVRVIGLLDMIRVSTQSFALRLDEGQETRGVLVTGQIVEARDLLEKRVLVLGKAVYRPSGSLLRIDAESISLTTAESSLWSRVPTPTGKTLDVASLRKPQGPRSGVAAIIGQWPGQESDEEIREMLEEIS